MTYPSINIQGNILSGEILEKIWNEEVNHQTTASFGLDKNVRVRDEIGLAWSTIRGLWQTFLKRRERIDPEDSGASETRNFWMLPFLATLGYDVEKANAEVIDGKTYAISHRAINISEFPIHIAGVNDSLDRRRDNSGPRLSPHALMQEYLNKTEDHLYALVTNGCQLRLLRDATRLVRQAYLEFDLEKMMEEELFADFAVLYRTLHATRMPMQKGEGESAIIEIYHQESLEAGSRIREKLSEAVEFSIRQMANGFLKHPQNELLRSSISDNRLNAETFYLYSLRLIYRVLFLLVIEDRGLVYPDKIGETLKKQRQNYLKYYSISRLRHLASRRLYVDGTKHDLWENLKVTFRLFEQQQSGQKLGLQALGSGIFSPEAMGGLSEATIDNMHLLDMMQRLSYFRDDDRKIWVKVNYSDLDVEEFGSVYEGLLEYKPVFNNEGSLPGFAFEKGDARSKSGSHYTPEELVRPLIKHSLDYIIDDCLKKPQERLKNPPANMPLKAMQEKALQAITVCDVACGSGHILLSAARRIATELAKVRTGEDQPSPTAMRTAMRDTIKQCIYGVDKNPLAVELCKVALWLEAHNPGEPLNFLDHHIKCGDSIVGLAHRSELENGIADEAFKTLPGDDIEIGAAFRNRNKLELKQKSQIGMFDATLTEEVNAIIEKFKLFKNLPETNPGEVAKKEKEYRNFENSVERIRLKQLADGQVAQFFIPKIYSTKAYLLTDAEYRGFLRNVNKGLGPIQSQKLAYAETLIPQHRFFHWFIEFPEVFNDGGFDCIIGNPPYLGGQKISGTFGFNYLEYIKYKYTCHKSPDLVTYFLLRNYFILKNNSFEAIITTNSINQGKTREEGLEQLLNWRAKINFAIKSIPWPGIAGVHVSLLSIHKGNLSIPPILGSRTVTFINSFLDDNTLEIPPFNLYKNMSKCFQGYILLGSGFIIERKLAHEFINEYEELSKNILPYINGDELNSKPVITNDHYAIDFSNKQFSEIVKFKSVYSYLENNVLPQRNKIVEDKINRGQELGVHDNRAKEEWWKYLWPRPELREALKKNNNVIAVSLTTKYLNFLILEKNKVYSHAVGVITDSNYIVFSILNSNFHEEWSRKYSSSLKSWLRYTPSISFETFPFPTLTLDDAQRLELFGQKFYNFRKQLMIEIQMGLTKTYNAFHAREIHNGITAKQIETLDKKALESLYGKEIWNLWNHLQKTSGTCAIEEAIEGIVTLRELHVQMDSVVLEAYGWQDVQLKHDFYEVDYLPENDRIRFTIHPDARKEILKRLLELNHKIHTEEVAAGLWDKKTKNYNTKKANISKVEEPVEGYGDLFEQPQKNKTP